MQRKYLILAILLLTIPLSTGFLGLFESEEEKNIKNLITIYYNYPLNDLKKLNLSSYPPDIQSTFKNLINAISKYDNCTSGFSLAMGLVQVFVDGMGGEQSDPLGDCQSTESSNVRAALNNFKQCCEKYGVKNKYFESEREKSGYKTRW